ncbi:MAG: hypothetical protein CMJ48_03065 [Planctomycetaceae bacterium]|nr:hypothetical protein [Planctomycetaceae bacterium]
MTRLASISEELVASLQDASVSKQRAASIAACRFALANASVDDSSVAEAVQVIEGGRSLSEQQGAALDALVARLDGEHLQLQEAEEEGRASSEDYMRVFGQARAVAAVAFAGGGDPFEAATEAIYEAAAATDSQDDLVARIEEALK